MGQSLGRAPARAAIVSADINDGIITSAHIASDTVVAADIASDAITLLELADNSVDTAAIVADAIDSQHYAAASIDNEHLADDAVGVAELSATGTASSSTFLRGDNAWEAATAIPGSSFMQSSTHQALTLGY